MKSVKLGTAMNCEYQILKELFLRPQGPLCTPSLLTDRRVDPSHTKNFQER